jgi:hypothetical protein
MTIAHTKDILDPILNTFTGDLITVSSQNGLPPGTRVAFLLSIASSTKPLPLSGKVVSVAQEERERFRLVIRLHSLTRQQGALLSLANPTKRT